MICISIFNSVFEYSYNVMHVGQIDNKHLVKLKGNRLKKKDVRRFIPSYIGVVGKSVQKWIPRSKINNFPTISPTVPFFNLI